MSSDKDELRLKKLAKENKLTQQQKKDEYKTKRDTRMKEIFTRNKLQKEHKKHIMKLNVIQTVILVVVIFIEVFSIYGYISEVFSIIGLIILCASCVIIMKKIKKTLQL